jgi:hypothetical protein
VTGRGSAGFPFAALRIPSLLLLGQLAACQDDVPAPFGDCSVEHAYACIEDRVWFCMEGDWGKSWQPGDFQSVGKQCLPGMCRTWSSGMAAGCLAPNAKCSRAGEGFCSDNVVVRCTPDMQPLIADDCNAQPIGVPQYCLLSRDGGQPQCSYYPELCAEGVKNMCINSKLDDTGPAGLVTCDGGGIAGNFRTYIPIDYEWCTIWPCPVDGQYACATKSSGRKVTVECVLGQWEPSTGPTCQ